MTKKKNLSKRKTKGVRQGVCGLIFLCLAALIIASCADDSSYEARIEEARMAIDDREYARARDLLLQLKAEYPGDPMILQYLSNAYAGLTGLDTFNLLTVIDQLNEAGGTGSIDMVGTVLGTAGGEIPVADIPGKLANLDEAIDNLKAILNPTEDQKVQLGLLSLNRAALTIAAIVADEQNLGPNDTVPLTEAGLGVLYGAAVPGFLTGYVTVDQTNSLLDDINNIGDAVDSIDAMTGTGEENDLGESFNKFQSDLDTDGVAGISQKDLEDYLMNL
jgi:hypothetical protein